MTAGGANGPVARAVRDAKRALARMARPAGDFDASRYFRGAGDLGFDASTRRALLEATRG